MPIKINHVYFVYLYIARYEFVSNVICLYCEIKYFLVVWNDITKRNINRNKCITYSYLFHTTNKNIVFVDVNLRLHVYIESFFKFFSCNHSIKINIILMPSK